MLDPGSGGGSYYTEPFVPHPASEVTVVGEGDALVDKGGEFANVATAVYLQAYKAALETDGLLKAPTVAAGDERYQEATRLKEASILAGGCTRKFGHAIGIFDDGVQSLNSEYWTARAKNFGVADVDSDDPTVKADPEKAEKRHGQMVDAAEQELMGRLKQRKLTLDGDLDEAAHGSSSMLDKGPSDAAMLALFQSGDLPIAATSLFPKMDFSKLDMRKLLEQQQKFGELPPGVSIDDLMASLDRMKRLADGEGDPFEMQQLLEDLKGLDPASFDYLVLGMTDEQLASLDGLASGAGGPMMGLDHWGGIDFHSLFLENASPQSLYRLEAEWPSINPDMSGADAVEDGDIGMPHWGDPPTDDLFTLDENGNPVISAEDINQGQLGDCWMQAKMAALAEQHPEWVTDHIEQNANGTVTVIMYDDDGNAHHVTVTNDLPVDENGELVFSGDANDNTWSAYYEKAFALASDHGSDSEDGYGGIEGGWGEDEADLMTGGDADDIDDSGGFIGIGDHEDMGDIRDHVEDGDAVVVGMNGDQPDGVENYHGNHEYYVKGFTDDGDIILGNPWGDGEPDLILTEDQFNDHCHDAAVINP